MIISYDIIKLCIDKCDPVGLLKIHAPSDEYDSESAKICNSIKNYKIPTIYNIAHTIYSVFNNSFGIDICYVSIAVCESMAKDIISMTERKVADKKHKTKIHQT